MWVLHGTWLPAEGEAFVRGGRFLLWAETGEEPPGRAAWSVMYADRETLDGLFERRLESLNTTAAACWWRVPVGKDRRPLPSPSLAQRLGVVIGPGAVSLSSLRLAARELPQPLAGLDELAFVLKHDDSRDDGDPLLRLGDALRFWLKVNRGLLKRMLRKDQYVPALRYRKQRGRHDVYPAWDPVAPDLESWLAAFAGAMPGACTAAVDADARPGPRQRLYDRAALLRHYLYFQLTAAVTAPDYPAALANRFNGSFIKACLRDDLSERVLRGDAADEQYRDWRRWRRRLAPPAASAGAGARLGLQLLEAPAEDASWRLQLLAMSNQDPELQLPLIEFWQLDAAAREALADRLGEHPEQALLTELGLAARVYPPLWQALNDRRPDALVLDTFAAFEFLRRAAVVLQDAGFRVLVPDWWTPQGRRRARLKLRVSPEQTQDADAGGQYFSADRLVRFHYRLALGDLEISPDEWRQLVATKAPLVRFRDQWVELDQRAMGELLEFWQQHGGREQALPLTELMRHSVLDGAELDARHNPALQEALAGLEQPARLTAVDDPPGLQGTLRAYQKRGVAWLAYLDRIGLNGCLADDMGLGKTVQVIARLLLEQDHEGNGLAPPTLLIAPTSVVGNWVKELQRFAPKLGVLLHHGAERCKTAAEFDVARARCFVVITSYALARRDAKLLGAVDWHRIVLDEAQHIKNPASAQTRAIVKFSARHRLALTGTPVENRLTDLWSIMQFLNPGYLGSRAQFRSRFELPIQKHGRAEPVEQLKTLIRPFVLRRLKTDKNVIDDLPDKIEQVQYCQLTAEQAALYQAVVAEVESSLKTAAADGIQRKGLILSALLQLKQICNHPRQFLQDHSVFAAERSHKLTRLDEMLGEVLAGGDSALIFTQFAELGGALERYLRRRHACPVHYLYGGVAQAKRERMVEAFQDPRREAGLFVLSLKAGGVGITLTRASQVFHFDRWWNPAVEDQATDRAFRIGQKRNVFVHKFVTLGTLEERIDQMLRDKKRLAEGVIGSTDESWLTELDNEQFRALIALDRRAVA